MNSDIEIELIDRLSKGDHLAFEKIYLLYKDRMYRFALSIVKSREKAEDISQNIFAALWSNYSASGNISNLSNYLYKMVRNESLNLVRSEKYAEQFQLYLVKEAIDFTINTQEEIGYNELASIISEALNSLTHRQREIYEMSRYSGKSHKEIAKALNISIHTVQEHISDALKKLSIVLKEYQIEYLSVLFLLIS